MAKQVLEIVGTSRVDSSTILEVMGFRGKSGPSTAALASLKQYGLIGGRDKDLHLTPLALQILQSSTHNERREGLHRAIMAPQFYAEILERCSGQVPTQQALKTALTKDFGFKVRAALRFIRVFDENRPYFGLGMESASHAEPAQSTVVRSARSHEDAAPRTDVSPGESYEFRVTPECSVSINYKGRISQRAIERTITFLELVRENFPPTL